MGRLLKAVVLGFFVVALCVDGQITASHTTPRRAAARRRQQAAQAAAHTNVGDSPVRPLERFPHSKPGQLDCLTDRAIPNWDSQESRVCDPAICNGTDALKFLTRPAQLQERFTPSQLEIYISDLSEPKKIDGWMVPVHGWLVGLLSRYQHSQGLYGSVGEIGVFQGKLFIALAGFSAQQESLVAADWFDAFHVRGYLEKFQKNLANYLHLDGAQMTIYQGDSNQLTPKWFSDRNLPFFRLLSVDASHDLKLVLRDFNLAGCLVIDGGIVIADDFGGASWMGVNSALYNFVFEQSRIVPFMMVANKLYLTTVSHHEEYYNMLANLPGVQCKENTEEQTQISMGDYRVCMLKHNSIGMYDTAGLLNLLTTTAEERAQTASS